MAEAEKTVFVEMFGENPTVKVLDFFLTFPIFDYSKTQVARETGVSRITIGSIWEGLIKEGIIVKTRKIGRAVMYKLNQESLRVKALIELDFKISKAFADEEIDKHKIVAKAR